MTCSDLFLEGLSFTRQRNSGEQYFRCNLYDFPFYNEFDAILACDVLEHLDDDITALYRLNQALKPGGICLITVPAGESLWSAVDLHGAINEGITGRFFSDSNLLLYDNSLSDPPGKASP